MLVWCCCSIFWLLMVILLPMSFQYVNYDEMAFARNTIRNKVDTSTVYYPGRYLLGPSVNMVTFPKVFRTLHFNMTDQTQLRLFNKEGMEINVEVHLEYSIEKAQIKQLMTTYGVDYVNKIRSVTESTLKNSGVGFSIVEFVNNRTQVSEVFNINAKEALAEIFINLDLYKLQLGRIILPEAQQQKFMEDAVVRQNAQRSGFEQQARLIRDETDRDVAEINANATFIEREAAANASKIREVDRAEADEIIAQAYGLGWNDIMGASGLNIADNDKAEFLRLMGIIDNPGSPHLIDKDLEVIVNQG